MRSWIKEPIILKNKDDMSIVFLFKTMVYDYMYADLDPIEKSCVTYILVNWRQLVTTTAVAQDLEDIVNKFIEANPTQVMNDLIVAIANAEIISDRIQYIAGEVQ